MGGPCEEVYEGETAMEIAKKSHAHVMATTDEAHMQMREQMTKPSEEEQKKWWAWFKGEWDKKKDD
ncbi:MAG: hypothetical protein HW412_6 [Bacteroidetes bacterium]|nr:hypothetical protein [Bacteroidota bacterium]